MLDLRLIRIQPDFVKQQLANLGADPSVVDRILDADERRRTVLKATEEAQARLKTTSKEIGRRRAQGEDTAETEEEARALREVIRESEASLGPI
ncbi:MAG: serine--tRNA ligase, partial [Armatimonadetes bacterium]|nr:serine--tRNA ligase [Armatimonadota bacterium]